MTERERLIELIKQVVHEYFAEDIADLLLENSIFVPPVKLGQIVYTIQGQRKYPKEWRVVGIWKSEEVCNFHMVCYIDGKFVESASIDEDLIGKSVFLTKEEAEQALKGGVE